jgi:6-phospho-beta-glucosidase
MKLAIIGGAGARVPLVLVGLLRFHNDLHTDEVVLWDVNSPRQDMIDRICAAMIERHGVPIKVRTGRTLEETLEGAHFIIASVRVGGIQTRVTDERIALAHGVLGQETVGPGGWAMALRTIPVILEYAQVAEEVAPKSWLLNFSNPVGIVLQALLAAGMERTIGVCDTPREMFESVAAQMGIASSAAFFDYLGLNHLGWLRSVQVNGRDRLAELLQSDEKLGHVYHVPLFSPEYLKNLEMLPTEYVYFYLNAARATEKLKQAAKTRGQMVAEQEEDLFRAVASAGTDNRQVVAAYDDFLANRNATYFQLETGASMNHEKLATARKELYAKAAGYERIAVDVMRSISGNRPTVFPVDVANNGAMDELGPNDAVEVPCVIDSNGAKPLAVGAIPEQARPLLLEVKHYERLTAQAALEGSARIAADALAANPLVKNGKLAQGMCSEYLQANEAYLGYLKS